MAGLRILLLRPNHNQLSAPRPRHLNNVKGFGGRYLTDRVESKRHDETVP